MKGEKPTGFLTDFLLTVSNSYSVLWRFWSVPTLCKLLYSSFEAFSIPVSHPNTNLTDTHGIAHFAADASVLSSRRKIYAAESGFVAARLAVVGTNLSSRALNSGFKFNSSLSCCSSRRGSLAVFSA